MAANRALQRRLFEGGYAGITWPKEYGGQGLPGEYESAFSDEAAGYVAAGFRRTLRHDLLRLRPHHAGLRPHPNSCADSCPGSWPASSSSASSSRSPRRDRTSPGPGPGPPGTASSGSSTARRSGARSRTWPMRACAWPARTGSVPKHQGLTWFPVPCDAPGLTIRPIKQINEAAEFCEEFFDDVVVPDADRAVRGQRGLGGHPDHVRVRAGRRATARTARPRRPRPAGPRPRANWPGGPDGSTIRSCDRSSPGPTPPTSSARCSSARIAQMGRLGLLNAGYRLLRQALPGHLQPDAGPPGRRDRRCGRHDLGRPTTPRAPSPRWPTVRDAARPLPAEPTRRNATSSASVPWGFPVSRASTPASRSARCCATRRTGPASV